MPSIRELLLQWSRVKSPRAQEPDDEVGLALEELLWTIQGLHVVVDGWALFRIIRESADSMDAAGLMALLPPAVVPIEINVKAAGQGLTWSVQVAHQDVAWNSLSHSKQWNSVYLYASGDQDPPRWNWGRRYQGSLSVGREEPKPAGVP